LNYSVTYAGFGCAIGARILASGTITGIELTAAVEVIGFVLATKNLVDA